MAVDFFSRFTSNIHVGVSACFQHIETPYSHTVYKVTEILYECGYMQEYKILVSAGGTRKMLRIYFNESSPALARLIRVSKPSKKIYTTVKKLIKDRRYKDCELGIITTTGGIMTFKECIELRLGGEILFILHRKN